MGGRWDAEVNLKFILSAVALAMIPFAGLAATMLDGLKSDPSIFVQPAIAGLEDLPIAPVLIAEIPSLDLHPTSESEPAQSVSTADWSSGNAGMLSHSTSVWQTPWVSVQWESDAAAKRVSTLKVALGGMTAILALALIGLAVGFLTIREPETDGHMFIPKR
jgi:hypothetical protein